MAGTFAGDGNIDADPIIIDSERGNYHLSVYSPCVNAGDPNYVIDPCETDIDGDQRVLDGRIDIGADEFNGEGPLMLIGVSPKNFDFVVRKDGPNPAEQILSVRNIGADTLIWEIAYSCPWLEAEPNNGESTGEIDEVVLSIDISGMTMGTYTCDLTISDPCALNSPQIVHITLEIIDNDGQLHVPSEYSTIQAGIDAAIDGESVIVAEGIYTGTGNKNLNFGGKAITVRSENGPDNCIIDCENSGRGFYFHSGEGLDSVLDGFTITNGDSSWGGGGICMEESNPTIKNCIICDNHSYDYGGGICFYAYDRAGPVITDCVIRNNTASNGGGIGYVLEEAWPMPPAGVISNCRITNNGYYAIYSAAAGDFSININNCLVNGNDGPGIFYEEYGGSDIITIGNCTIINNGDGIVISGSATTTITNCIIWGNGDDLDGCSATYSCIEDNDSGTGNIHSDPCFVTGWLGDYYLSQVAAGQDCNSPCVDAGSDTAANLGLDELTTRIDLVGDEGTVDMGYHYPRINCASVDIDGDGDVDLADFAILGSQWQKGYKEYGGLLTADVAPRGGDGIVDMCDVGLMVENYLSGKDPVVHWKFDEGSGTEANDSSGNENHGTLVDDPCWVSAKIGDYALYFDGDDDYIDCGNDSTLNFGTSDSFTISAWIKTPGEHDGSTGDYIIGKRGDSSPYTYALGIDTSDVVQLWVYDGTNAPHADTTTVFNDNQWHHVEGVRNVSADTLSIYVDGVLEHSVTDTVTGSIASTNSMSIGCALRSTGPIANTYFNGTIDDVRIYSWALPDEEIQKLYQAGLD